PKKFHAYWRVEGMALKDFKPVQTAISKRWGSDPKVNDLPRVMRLPGFMHMKGKPFLIRIKHLDERAPYPASTFPVNKPPARKRQRINNLPPADIKEINAALEVLPADDYQIWFEVGSALHKEFGDEKGFPIFDKWARKSEKYNKRESERKWDECQKVNGFN